MRNYTLLLLAICMTLTACEKVIPYEEETYEEGIVLNGVLVADEEAVVDIGRTQSILEERFDPVTFEPINTALDGCTVSLYENGTLVSQTSESENGQYNLGHIATAGNEYRIEVSHPDLPSVRAETNIPNAVPIIAATGAQTQQFSSRVSLSWQDRPDVSFYALGLFRVSGEGPSTYRSSAGWSTSSPYFPIDATGDGENYFYNDGVFLDDLFEDQSASISLETFEFSEDEEGTFLEAALLSCSESYYLYKSSYRLYQESDGGLFAQPVQVFSNVEGGFGIWAGVSISRRPVDF